ncbi:MFS transporter [soil metagenome]
MRQTLSKLLLSVYLPTLILSFCNGLLLPVLPLYAGVFTNAYSLIGLVLAAEAIGTLLADLPAGGLLRRVDRKWVMVVGVALVGVSVVALVWASTLLEVLGYRLLAGVGGALWNLSRHAYLAEATVSAQRGRTIALFGGTNRLGTFAGPAVGGLVAAALGYGAVFVLYAALAGITVVLAFLFIEKAEPAAPPDLQTPGHDLWTVLRSQRRVLAAAGSAQLLAQMVRASRRVLIPLYGADVLGLGVEAVGLILSVSSFVDMALFYPAGVIMDRWGRKFAILPCFALQAVGVLLIPLTTGFVPLLLVASLIGFGNGLGSGTMMTLGADLAPRGVLGEFLGVWRLIGDGGATGAPLIVGAVADVLSLATAAVVMAAVGAAAVALFTFTVPETLERPHPASP